MHCGYCWPIDRLAHPAVIQLSGHTHGGLLFFLKWLLASFNGGLVQGVYDVDGMTIQVSPGTGLWAGFSCRLGVPSEITRIVLRAAGKQSHFG
jgi:predicted MPP superfamily phosphohydrolase